MEVSETYDKNGKKQLDLQDLCKQLGEQKIDSVLLEGGAALNGSAFTGGNCKLRADLYCTKDFWRAGSKITGRRKRCQAGM